MPLKQLFSFRGRSGRKAYWLIQIGALIAVPILAVLSLTVVDELGRAVPLERKPFVQMVVLAVTALVVGLFIGLPMLASLVKRLHDRGRSGVVLWVAIIAACSSAVATAYAWLDALNGTQVGPQAGPHEFSVFVAATVLIALAAATVSIGALPVAFFGFAPLFIERFALSSTPVIAAALALALLLIGLWFAIELGILTGSPGSNRYGSGSSESDTSSAAEPIFHRIYRIAGGVALVTVLAVGITSYFVIRDSRTVSAFRDCETCPEMIDIPAGSFEMGLDKQVANMSAGRMDLADTAPAHTVQVPAFALGKYEVTFEEWDACVKDAACHHSPSDATWGRGRRPVIGVSWSDANEYAQWLSQKTGKSYRLPSEAEWEYAVRAGSTKRDRFEWGKILSEAKRVCRFENYADLSYDEGRDTYFPCYNSEGKKVACEIDQRKCRDGFATTAPVGSLWPNYFGLYDMQGNVAEWIQDCWHGNYTGAPADGSAWLTTNCTSRVVRGQDWRSWWPLWNGWGEFAQRTFSPDDRTDSNGKPNTMRGFRIARGN